MSSDNGVVRKHFAASVYVVDYSQVEPRVLLLKHKRIPSWLPPGGHVDENELPTECALRELREETGVNAVLDGGNNGKKFHERITLLPQPHHIQLEEIEPGTHYHIDFIYFAELEGSPEITDAENHGQIMWFTRGELQAVPEKEIFPEARKWALEALGEIVG